MAVHRFAKSEEAISLRKPAHGHFCQAAGALSDDLGEDPHLGIGGQRLQRATYELCQDSLRRAARIEYAIKAEIDQHKKKKGILKGIQGKKGTPRCVDLDWEPLARPARPWSRLIQSSRRLKGRQLCKADRPR